MARNIRFDAPLTPGSTHFGRLNKSTSSRPSTPVLKTNVPKLSKPPVPSAASPSDTIVVMPPREVGASTPSRSESPLSSVPSVTAFTPVNAVTEDPVSLSTIVGTRPASAYVFTLPATSTGQVLPSNQELVNPVAYKEYEHPGFPPGTFDHSNYEYRQYKTSAPPDFRPYTHPAFPPGTFNNNNYGYRNNKSGLNGRPMSRSNSMTPSDRAPTPQATHLDPTTKKQKKNSPRPLQQGSQATSQQLQLQLLQKHQEQQMQQFQQFQAQQQQFQEFLAQQQEFQQFQAQQHQLQRQQLQQQQSASTRRRASSADSSGLSSVQIVSPPITPIISSPRSRAPQNEIQSTRLIIRVNKDEAGKDVRPTGRPQKHIDRSPPPALRARTPPPAKYDPSDPDGEFSRPSVTTLRAWDGENGATSMVQDYRMLMGGVLMVGKVESEW